MHVTFYLWLDTIILWSTRCQVSLILESYLWCIAAYEVDGHGHGIETQRSTLLAEQHTYPDH